MKNVIEYLEESARKFPQKGLFIDSDKRVTYADVVGQCKAIATKILQKTEDSINTPVAIYMGKSVDLLISFMAVTYSGNFYTPLDTTSPASRIQKIIDTLKPAVIITTQADFSNVKALGFEEDQILLFEEIVRTTVNEDKIAAALAKKIDTDPLYVLFTSGSTGIPKGVAINHRSVIDYIEWCCKMLPINEDSVFGNQAPFYFDNSILDIYCTLKQGGTLHIIPPTLFMFPGKLLDFLESNGINTIFWVPSALIYVANSGILSEAKPTYLKSIFFCGEVMPNKQLNIWRAAVPDATYVNLYGPTEITDACTYFIVIRTMRDDEPLPIGFPCDNTDIIVLNEKNERATGEEKGELCVRGSSLALGYYNNPEKTKEAFIQNPLNPYYPELIYRTGDIVKYNERGELIYLCRKDFQIKHMGHRIEIGEIETAVLALSCVENGCIIYDDKSEKIVLFYQSAEACSKEIIKGLRDALPKYMLPNKLICMQALPMNANGKIDRVKLKAEL